MLLVLVACMQMLLLLALPLLLLMRHPVLMLLGWGWGRGEAGGRWGEPLALEEDGLAGLPRWLPPITATNSIHTSIAHNRVPRLLLCPILTAARTGICHLRLRVYSMLLCVILVASA